MPATTRFATFPSQKTGSLSQHAAAFRACFERFQDCLEFGGSPTASPVLEAAADFVLDFDITARRTLGAETARYKLFQLYFLKSQTRQSCCSKLSLSEWDFAFEIRAIEQGLGESFATAGLFPLAPYFAEACPGIEKIAA